MKETTDPSGAGECEDNNQQKLEGKTIGKEIETMEGAGLLSLSIRCGCWSLPLVSGGMDGWVCRLPTRIRRQY